MKLPVPFPFPPLPKRLLPAALPTEVFVRLGNHLLRGQSIASRLGELNGKTICITIRDLDLDLRIAINNGKLQRASSVSGAHPSARPWDVRISGMLYDFLLLASRREDPDTLFFNRRLSLEGDTGTGLLLKNLLDALEFDWRTHFHTVLGLNRPQNHPQGL